ncbi:MAG TPA: flagellar hook-basal body complex protein, partial [Syntrophomonadaceae bacterium]|nr:flagellar hook-basal body complex protein [Syntrophomonadaceae bacterium]
MMRSMYSAVSGLKNHQTRMDVIGNNIANVNTAGYKKSRVVFKDTLYQSIRGASRPTDARGGTNPMGVGLGMTLASIDQIHTPSPTTVTNKLTDMAVDGNGYFMVNNGGERFYTRAGNFDFDKVGNLVMTSNGYYVQGWMADKDGRINTTGEAQRIDISGYKTVEPNQTTSMQFSGNLNSELSAVAFGPTDTQYPGEEESVITSKEIYDSLGNRQTLYFRFFKYQEDDTPKWACDISLDPLFEGQ